MAATHKTTTTCKITRWTDGAHSVLKIRSLFGLPTYWLVTRKVWNGNEEIVSRHRLESAARKSFASYQGRATSPQRRSK